MRTKKQISEYNKGYYQKNKKKVLTRIKENFDKKPIEIKREIWRNHSGYFKKWFKNKYHNDPVFRKKHIERVKKNNKKRR